MAINVTTFSPDQFLLAMIPETTTGTKVVASMHKLDVDRPITFAENPYVADSPRLGTGRAIKVTDRYVQPKGALKSLTFSGIADKTTFPILAENAFSIAEATGTIDVPYNFTGHAVGIGDAAADNIHALTVVLVQPISNKSIVFPGCFVSSLQWIEDTKADEGRRRYTCSVMSRATVEHDANDPTYANDGALYGSYYSIYDYDGTNGQKKLFVNDIVMDRLMVNIETNVKWQGVGTNGVGETVTRGLPRLVVTGEVDTKWDANTQPLVQRAAPTNTTSTSGTLVVGNVYRINTFVAGDDFTNVGAASNASGEIFQASGTTPTTWTNGSTLECFLNFIAVDIRDHTTLASATTGFKGDYCAITGDLNTGNIEEGAYITLPFEAHTINVASTYLCQIPV